MRPQEAEDAGNVRLQEMREVGTFQFAIWLREGEGSRPQWEGSAGVGSRGPKGRRATPGHGLPPEGGEAPWKVLPANDTVKSSIRH